MKIEKWNGKTITRPGIYSGVPLDVYHSQEILDGPSVSSSGLRRALERNGGSPAHFYDEWSGNPNCADPEDEKKHFILGRAVHHLLLGEVGFANSFIVRPNTIKDPATGNTVAWDGKRTECKEWLAMARKTGRAVLTESDIGDIRGMAMSIGRHPEVNIEYKPGRFYSLLNGHIEKSFFWKDKRTGLWLKARPDSIPTDSGDYADLKTTTSVARLAVIRAITDFAYHQQAALIGEGSKQCAGIEMSSYTLIFVEKKRPHCARPVPLDQDDIALGAQQNRIALDLIAHCIEENRWPGPGDDTLMSLSLSDAYRERAASDVARYKLEQQQRERETV